MKTTPRKTSVSAAAFCVVILVVSYLTLRVAETDAKDAPASAVPSVAAVDPTIDARAREWWQRILDANPARAEMEPKISSALTDNAFKSVQRSVRSFGTAKSFNYIGSRDDGNNTIYMYRITYTSTKITYGFELDEDGKISGLSFDDGSS